MKNWKRKFHSTFTEKKLGFGIATLIKNDIKSAFVNNIQSNLRLSGIYSPGQNIYDKL